MKKYFVILSLSLGLIFIGSISCWAASDWTGNVNLLYGTKSIDGNDYWWMYSQYGDHTRTDIDGIASQKMMGLSIDFGGKTWPVNIVIGIVKSNDEYTSRYYSPWFDTTAIKIESSTTELRFGVKKAFEVMPKIYPYIEGGLVSIKVEGKYNWDSDISGSWRTSDDGSVLGYWLAGGAYYLLADHFNLGFELGYSKGKVDIFDGDMQGGGTNYGLFIGYHW